MPQGLVIATIAMAAIVAASNILVQFPVNDWLTWGAFTYPVAFLVTDLTNRTLGPRTARQVVYVGFVLAVILSALLATPRIAVASGLAFFTAQLLDIRVFDRLRHSQRWWVPPFVSSSAGSAVDTFLFFSIAFYGTGLPWVTLGLGDLAIKLLVAVLSLLLFRGLMPIMRPGEA